MELRYVVMTIIKILLSVPTIVDARDGFVSSTTPPMAVTMSMMVGGHIDNGQNETTSESMPDPSPLVLPGYNLPENIFNHGKPFYLEKDPLTGKIDFGLGGNPHDDFEYEYVEEYVPVEKAEGFSDRKDTVSFVSYGESNNNRLGTGDVDRLNPHPHDFLNLPVKYHPEKYVYPLISNSYANTKVQGNTVGKYHNHKDVGASKLTVNPTYQRTPSTTTTTTTTSTTVRPTPPTTTTTVATTTMTKKLFINGTSTKRPLSLFEQLFGEYDDVEKTSTTSQPTTTDRRNVLTGTAMGHDGTIYEYDEYESVPEADSNSLYVPTTIKVTTVPTTTTSTTTSAPSIVTPEATTPTTTTTSTTTASTTKTTTSMTTAETESTEYYDEWESASEKSPESPSVSSTTAPSTKNIVTSLPLGDNHIGQNKRPILAVTQYNLRDQLATEKVFIRPFDHQLVPSSNSIRISPDQNTVSFVLGNHQNVGGVGSNVASNPISPAYHYEPFISVPMYGGSMPVVDASETSLSIGAPINDVKKVPGHVMDEDLDDDKIRFGGSTSNRVVFPPEEHPVVVPIQPSSADLVPPPPPSSSHHRDILLLDSRPVYHQLPSDLTPPQPNLRPIGPRPRPPWDPRPGHFHDAGRPEYSRPPRPPQPTDNNPIMHKRIDSNLPNILPQFRPNVVSKYHHARPSSSVQHNTGGFQRQPLLERPTGNRPVGFFEKLVPPPPPPKNLHKLRKSPGVLEKLQKRQQGPQQQQHKNALVVDRRFEETGSKGAEQQYDFYPPPHPPKVSVPTNSILRRDEEPPETLQMMQSKSSSSSLTSSAAPIRPSSTPSPIVVPQQHQITSSDKPLYVVYPVNVAPVKLDAFELPSLGKRESVVVGTRAEPPAPPSPGAEAFNPYDSIKERNDAPILRPHVKPPTLQVTNGKPIQISGSFPYPLERPNGLGIDDKWNSAELEARIVNSKVPARTPDEISATLKTYTPERPIAVAYTPTSTTTGEPYRSNSAEITLGAIVRTHPQHQQHPERLDFQAPFHASVSFDSGYSSGWTVVRDGDTNNIDRSDDGIETTTQPVASSTKFDVNNFRPQMISGFKPIYNYSADDPIGQKKGQSDDQRA